MFLLGRVSVEFPLYRGFLGEDGGLFGKESIFLMSFGSFRRSLLRESVLAGSVADSIKPQDLELGTFEQQNRGDRGFGDDGQGNWRPIMSRYAPPISYLHLYDCDLFSV